MIYITGDCHGDFRKFNKKIFTFGGAKSHDISDGILRFYYHDDKNVNKKEILLYDQMIQVV